MMKKYSRYFRRSIELISVLVIGGLGALPTSAQTLPKRVIADSSFAWEADGIQPDTRWQYGYYATASDASTFIQATVWRTYYPGSNSWIGAGGEIWDSSGYPRIGKYAVAPSPTRQVVRRWTSNFKGEVTLQIDCQQLQDSLNNQKFQLFRNGILERTFTKSEASHHLVFVEPCQIEVGDELDFLIDSLGNSNADWTHLSIRIATENPVDDALVYFPFDETNDLPTGWAAHGPLYDRRSRVADYSGSDHHAVLVNMDRDLASQIGKHDQSRFFDGVDDHLAVEEENLGDGLREITLSTWVRPDSKGTREGFISSTGVDHIGFSFAAANEGNGFPVKFSAKGLAAVGPDACCPVGEWTHVTGVWKSGQIHKLYLNGNKVTELEAPAGGSLDVTEWFFGTDRNLPNRYFNGLLDESLIIPRALTDTQVRQLYRSHATFAGVVGEARYCDGVNDVALVEPAENGATEITLAAWVSPFRKKDNATVVSSLGNDFFGLLFSGYGEGNPIEFRAKSNRLTAPDDTCPTGQWNHVAGVWKSGQLQKLYLNGVEVADHANPPSGAVDISQWVVARDRQSQNRYYHGFVDDLTILPQALDAAGVDALYRRNLPVSHAGPVEMGGFLRWDYYYPFSHETTAEVTVDQSFFASNTSSGHTGFLDNASTEVPHSDQSVTLLRGYIEPPETGEYFFWISGRNALDLFLSPNDQKYEKEVIARISPDLGSGFGIPANSANRWDAFLFQLSEPIELVAGQRYTAARHDL